MAIYPGKNAGEFFVIISLFDEDFNDRVEALLDKMYLTYHNIHYPVGPIDIQSFARRKEGREARKEILDKQVQLYKKGKKNGPK